MSLEEAIEMKPELEAARAQTADMVRTPKHSSALIKRRPTFPKLVLFERAPVTLCIAIAMDGNKMQHDAHTHAFILPVDKLQAAF